MKTTLRMPRLPHVSSPQECNTRLEGSGRVQHFEHWILIPGKEKRTLELNESEDGDRGSAPVHPMTVKLVEPQIPLPNLEALVLVEPEHCEFEFDFETICTLTATL